MALITQTGQQYYSTASPKPFGDYQFISLEHVINQFIIAYVGENKIISKIKIYFQVVNMYIIIY